MGDLLAKGQNGKEKKGGKKLGLREEEVRMKMNRPLKGKCTEMEIASWMQLEQK